MSQETNNPGNQDSGQEVHYTPEELGAMRKMMISNYKAEISFLKVQEQYEKLSADIEEHKTRKYKAMAVSAQIFAAQEAAEKEEAELKTVKKERTLKKETSDV